MSWRLYLVVPYFFASPGHAIPELEKSYVALSATDFKPVNVSEVGCQHIRMHSQVP